MGKWAVQRGSKIVQGGHKTGSDRDCDELGSSARADSFLRVAHVPLHLLRRDTQTRGDLGVAKPVAEKGDDLELPRGGAAHPADLD